MVWQESMKPTARENLREGGKRAGFSGATRKDLTVAPMLFMLLLEQQSAQ
jgi:hypothetical protein